MATNYVVTFINKSGVIVKREIINPANLTGFAGLSYAESFFAETELVVNAGGEVTIKEVPPKPASEE